MRLARIILLKSREGRGICSFFLRGTDRLPLQEHPEKIQISPKLLYFQMCPGAT